MNHRPSLTTLGVLVSGMLKNLQYTPIPRADVPLLYCSIQSIYIKLVYCLGITCIHYIHVEKEWKGLLFKNVIIAIKQLILSEYASIVVLYVVCLYPPQKLLNKMITLSSFC